MVTSPELATPWKTRFAEHFASRTAMLLLCAAYFGVLNWSYVAVDSQLYGGFAYNPPPTEYIFIALLCAVAPALWLHIGADRPSYLCCWLLYLTVYVPSTFIPFHISRQPPGRVLVLPLYLLFLFALLYAVATRRAWHLRLARISPRQFSTLILLGGLALAAIVVLTAGGLHLNFNLSDEVYDRRFVAAELTGRNRAFSYATATLSGCFLPLTLAYGITRRSSAHIATGIFGALVLFSFAGTKSDLFTPPFLILLAYLLRHCQATFGAILLLGAIGLVSAGILQYEFTERFDISSLLVRRQLLGPGQLTGCYWDFFTHNPHVYYADKFLRGFINSPYELSTTQLIGEAYFTDDMNSANANCWASAFAHGGYLAMFVTTLALGGFLRILDGLAHRRDLVFVQLIVSTMTLAWANAAFETSLLSNGVFLSTLLLLLADEGKRPRGVHPNAYGYRTAKQPSLVRTAP